MQKTTVYLPAELKLRVERVARQQNRSEADVIREALEQFTSAQERPRPTLPLFRGEPITDFDEAMRGLGED